MNLLGRLAAILALLSVVVLTPATPAAAVVHARTCEKYAGTPASSWYGVNICIKVEYLPGGVRALLAFDCFYVVLDPFREIDTACNYEVEDLWLNGSGVVRRSLAYGHITGTGYHQFATPWYQCNENKTTTYYASVAGANVRFPNGQLYENGAFSSAPLATISCA